MFSLHLKFKFDKNLILIVLYVLYKFTHFTYHTTLLYYLHFYKPFEGILFYSHFNFLLFIHKLSSHFVQNCFSNSMSYQIFYYKNIYSIRK